MKNIPLAKPFFDQAETDAITEVMASGMVSQGKKVEEFEEKVRKYVGAKYAVAVSSCTAGLYLALRDSVDLWDTEVAIPAFTFPAAQMCVKHFSGEMAVEHVDVDKNTYNIDTHDLENKVIRKNKLQSFDEVDVIIPIHQYGLPCNMDEIRRIASIGEQFVLEDAACALGSEYKGEKIGRRGTCVFSFHGRKICTTGEGGMVVTDDEELYEKVLEGRQFGRNKQGQFYGTGLNWKMSDIHAAIGIAQMEKLPEILSRRSFVAKTYNETLFQHTERDSLSSMRGMDIGLPSQIDYLYGDCRTNWQSYVVRLTPQMKNGVIPGRDLIKDRMIAKGIEVQVGSFDNSGGACKVSAELAATTLALPIYAGMYDEDVERVVTTLEEAMR